MLRKKCLLIIGGSGQLGSKVVDKFVEGGFGRKWSVFNIDLKENKKATQNFVVNPSEGISKEQVSELHD